MPDNICSECVYEIGFRWFEFSNSLRMTFQAIGNRLEEMLTEDKKYIDNVANIVTDPDGQRDLLQQDEEEDFLDEGILLQIEVYSMLVTNKVQFTLLHFQLAYVCPGSRSALIALARCE